MKKGSYISGSTFGITMGRGLADVGPGGWRARGSGRVELASVPGAEPLLVRQFEAHVGATEWKNLLQF